ncbi:MAG: hypothetical protein AAB966_00145, partial [Patescibacteria group bacterium]
MRNNNKTNSNPNQELRLGKREETLEELNLIEIQKDSWQRFIQKDLRQIITEFFPIDDYTGKKFTLFFDDFYFADTRYPLELCLQKKLTYDTPVYLKLRLLNKKTGTEKKQDVYFFNLPKMTDRGT